MIAMALAKITCVMSGAVKNADGKVMAAGLWSAGFPRGHGGDRTDALRPTH